MNTDLCDWINRGRQHKKEGTICVGLKSNEVKKIEPTT